MNQSLPVSHNVKVDLNRPPSSAEEYMLRVRMEAESMPVVLRVPQEETGEAAPPPAANQSEERFERVYARAAVAARCPPGARPRGGGGGGEQWAADTLRAFADLRQHLDYAFANGVGSKESDKRKAVPAMKDFLGWLVIFYGPRALDLYHTHFRDEEEDEEDGGEQARGNVDGADGEGGGRGGQEGAGEGPPRAEEEGEGGRGGAPPPPRQTPAAAEDGPAAAAAAAGEGGEGGALSWRREQRPPAARVSGTMAAPVKGPAQTPSQAGLRGRAWLLPAQEGGHPLGLPPAVPLLLQFDQVLTQRLLGYCEDILAVQQLDATIGVWLYGLLARIQWPLHRDTAAVLRSILRHCCNQRQDLVQNVIENENSKSVSSSKHVTANAKEQIIPMLNIIILITGTYFRQGEEQEWS